jgi:hypothetical protein
LTDDPHADGGEDGEECEDEDGGHWVILFIEDPKIYPH